MNARRRRLLTFALLAAGCGKTNGWSPTAAESTPELFVVGETARYSGIAAQRVRGEISETLYAVACLDGSPICHAFGWYVGGYGKGAKGTAYYYQPDVNRADDPSLSWAASHEVCHSVTGPAHDPKHAGCNYSLFGGTAPAGAARFRCRLDLDRPERDR
jgi:hypothetical protein